MAATLNNQNSNEEANRISNLTSAIPVVDFVDDVDAFMSLPENGHNSQSVLKRMEDVYSRAKVIEVNNVTTKRRLKTQVLDLDKSLKMIQELKRRKEDNEDMSTHFRLADHVFMKARIKPVDKVGLWLGANVMLEYDVAEGEELLKSKKEKAETSLKATNEVIDTIREQITTIEVNMARIFNWDVKRRQAEKELLGVKSHKSKQVWIN